MSELPGQPDAGEPQQKIENLPEILFESAPETGKELKPENPEALAEEIKQLKQVVEKAVEHKAPEAKEENPATKQAKIKQYQKRYLPEHLRRKEDIISNTLTWLWTRILKFETQGKENLPEKGPFIVVCNHFGGGDAQALLKTFESFDPHIAVAKEIWWNNTAPVKWLLKKFRMIPVEESLSNLTEQEKEEALSRQDKKGQAVFRKIIDREKQGKPTMNVEFVRQAVATLSRGDVLCVFPEGLWLNPQGSIREKAEMKQAYRGIELLVREFERLTGKKLPIVPTAFVEDRTTGKKTLKIGEQLLFSENNSGLNNTDWAMAHVASMLPEEQRGYYGKTVSDKLE